jgi:hypothetical protein
MGIGAVNILKKQIRGDNMLKTAKIMLLIATGVVFTQPAFAKSCDVEYFYGLCTGCTMNLKWKMKRFDKSEKKRWCLFNFGTSTNARKGFTVLDGFSLGEIRTGVDWVRLSALKTGQDRVTVQLHGVNQWGKSYASTINFNVEVVEGDF